MLTTEIQTCNGTGDSKRKNPTNLSLSVTLIWSIFGNKSLNAKVHMETP